MNNVAVIDYDAGNTMSVMKALDFLGMNVVLTRDRQTLMNSDRIILPGVGAFYDCMKKLEEFELISTIRELTETKIPFLGICLGMQLLFESSEETIGSTGNVNAVNGLGILKGNIRRFKDTGDLKVPHMGWNSLSIKNNTGLFKGLEKEPYVYFVHSYYVDAHDKSIVSATCEYSRSFDASIESGNIFACQFHPEKSGNTGIKILQNFCEIK